MKKLLSVLPSTLQGGFRGGLLFLALLATTTLWAYDFQSGDLYYNIMSNQEPYAVEVTRNDSLYSGDITIPETVEYNGITYSVTKIGDGAFGNCPALTSITIPNSVTSIGRGAFENCVSITSITIPENLVDMGFDLCRGCTSLQTIVWNAINMQCYIDGSPFYNLDAKQITSFTIGDKVQHIPAFLCAWMINLTSIIIPESVTSIGNDAFYDCIFAKDNFINNSSLDAETNNYWGAKVGDVEIDGMLIKNDIVIECRPFVTTAIIPESVMSIGDYAFAYCSALTSVSIGNSVTSIGDYAFAYCYALTSVSIGNSVTSIGDRAFYDCIFAKDNFINNSSLDAETNNYWGAKVGDVEIDGMLIKNDIVIDCRPFVTISIIPESVTSIGDRAFYNCSALTSVSIGNSVTSIGDYAFYDCSALTSVSIGNSVTSIGGGAFEGCSSLTSITIPNSIMSIGDRVFYGCSGLTSVTIPESVTSIGDYAFAYCSALTSVSIGNSVTSIGYKTFYGCRSLISVTIGNSVTSIGGFAFYNCSSLTSITIPNSVTNIEGRAFESCSALTSITCEARIPPTIEFGAIDPFAYVNKSIPVYVPCGCVSAYNAARSWKDFTNIQEPQAEYSIKVSTSNNQMGSAKVDYNTFCDGNQITATANYGYHFVQWSDGVIDNPRTLTLTQDTVLTAEFALTTAGQCGKNLYWVYDTNKSTLTITGSGDMYNERPWGLFATDLTEVALPEGLTHIGDGAFVDCINLKAITIPASVTSIGDQAFAGCRNLRNVNCYPLLPPYAETTSFANYNVNLNVPCDYLEDYQYDIVFGSFKYIQCISSDEVEDTDDVEIDAGTTDVTIIWPTEENAYTYTIVIKKNGQVVCTLTFNANGQLLNIAFAPGRDGNHIAQYAEQTGTGGFRFTVTGLEEGTDYTYDITTADESDNTISTHSGEFTTKSNTPTGLENTNSQSPSTNPQKLLRDGQLYIYHNGSTYTIMGAEIQ